MPKYIAPEFFDDFKCVGSDCPDNCCRLSTWSITIDGGTLERYRAIPGELGEKINAHIKEDDGKHFFINESGLCPMLCEDGLCRLIKELDYSYLSGTCKTHPRTYNAFNGCVEISLSLACPVAAGMALLRPEGFGFSDTDDFKAKGADRAEDERPNAFETAKFRVRAFLMGVMRTKGMSLMTKLYFCGLFVKAIEKQGRDYNFAQAVERLISDFLRTLPKAGELLEKGRAAFARLTAERREFALHNVLGLAWQIAQNDENAPDKAMNDRIRSFKESPPRAGEAARMFDALAVPFVNANAKLIENYVVYRLYQTAFPKDCQNIEHGFRAFLAELLMQLLFIAAIYKDKEDEGGIIGEGEAINAIYRFHRRLSHNPQMFADLADIFKDIDVPIGSLLACFGNIT